MSVSEISNTLATFGRSCISSPAMAVRGFIAVAAAEMAIRSILDIGKMITAQPKQRQAAFNDFSADLGGAVFYGLAAANIVPASGLIAGIIFVAHSTFKCCKRENNSQVNNDYFMANAIGFTVKGMWDRAICPIVNHIIGPVAEKIWIAIGCIFECLGKALGVIVNIHPVWGGVSLLLCGIGCYKGIPLVMAAGRGAAIGVATAL